MKKIIVTGGCGYIGSRLVPFLLERGYWVKVIDKLDFYNNLTPHPNLVIDERDILQTNLDDYEGFDCLIHLAGLSNDPMANFSPKDNFIQNLGVSGLVAFYAKTVGIKKFIFASSCSVYGNSGHDLCNETSKPIATFPYGVSKIQTENFLYSMVDSDFEVTCLRQATVYGWSPRMRTDLVVNTMTKTSILEKRIYLHDDSVYRPLIHLDDLCEVYLRCIETDNLPFIINVTSKNYSLKQISQEVRESVKAKLGDIQIECKNLTDPRSYCVDNELMISVLGSWKFNSIEKGVNDLLNMTDINDIGYWKNPDWINLEMYKKNYNYE
jgi:nucleoside-diphosphate-sugar epimerase